MKDVNLIIMLLSLSNLLFLGTTVWLVLKRDEYRADAHTLYTLMGRYGKVFKDVQEEREKSND